MSCVAHALPSASHTRTQVDLHGYDIAGAYAALRLVLRDAAFTPTDSWAEPDSGDRLVYR